MYQGEQLQRNLEREIRKQKDIHILAKSSGDIDLMSKAQLKITQLTRKYHQLSEVSGLSTKMKRMSVSGYRRVAKIKLK